MNTIKNILLKILGPLILSKSKIVKIEDISDKLRILTIKGKSLKKANWIPGQKVTLKLNDKDLRSYTPLSWNKEEGSFQTAVYLHNNGPLSRWASNIQLNSKVTVMGPRASLALENSIESFVFFGDETTFGLAHALNEAHKGKQKISFVLESYNIHEAKKALDHLKLSNSHLIQAGEIEAACNLILADFNNFHGNKKIILSGKQQNMVKIRQALLAAGLENKDITMKVYWGWKDDPNGKLKLV